MFIEISSENLTAAEMFWRTTSNVDAILRRISGREAQKKEKKKMNEREKETNRMESHGKQNAKVTFEQQ